MSVESGQIIQVAIINGPGAPSSVQATVNSASGEQAFNLNPAEQTFFEEALQPGPALLQIDAVYDNVLGVQAFVSYVFRLNVLPAVDQGGAEPPVPTQEVFDEPTEVVVTAARRD